jgi:hypothetical protein
MLVLSLFPKIKSEAGIVTLFMAIQHYSGDPSQSSRVRQCTEFMIEINKSVYLKGIGRYIYIYTNSK